VVANDQGRRDHAGVDVVGLEHAVGDLAAHRFSGRRPGDPTLTDLMQGKTVTCEDRGTDRYGRRMVLAKGREILEVARIILE
jgi:hypothetical protein